MADDKKYGSIIGLTLIDTSKEGSPIRVSAVEHRGRMVVDVRQMYTQDDKLKFGKGVRFEVEIAEQVIEAIGVALQMVEKSKESE